MMKGIYTNTVQMERSRIRLLPPNGDVEGLIPLLPWQQRLEHLRSRIASFASRSENLMARGIKVPRTAGTAAALNRPKSRISVVLSDDPQKVYVYRYTWTSTKPASYIHASRPLAAIQIHSFAFLQLSADHTQPRPLVADDTAIRTVPVPSQIMDFGPASWLQERELFPDELLPVAHAEYEKATEDIVEKSVRLAAKETRHRWLSIRLDLVWRCYLGRPAR
jgi:hypothetical protein